MIAYLALTWALNTTSGHPVWPPKFLELFVVLLVWSTAIPVSQCWSCWQPWSCACVCWTSSQQHKWQVLVMWKNFINKRNFKTIIPALLVSFSPAVILYMDWFLFLSFRIHVQSSVLLSSPESHSGGSLGKIKLLHKEPVQIRWHFGILLSELN